MALKKGTTPKKRAPGAIRAPPTPQEVGCKIMSNKPSSSKGTQSGCKGTQAKRGQNTEDDNFSGSDENDELSLAAKRMFGQSTTAKEAIPPEDARSSIKPQGAIKVRPTA